MIWSMLSLLLFLTLAVKAMFFSDAYRQGSHLLWHRVPIYLLAVYGGYGVIGMVYGLINPGPVTTMFNLLLLVGTFMIRPHHCTRHTFSHQTSQR